MNSVAKIARGEEGLEEKPYGHNSGPPSKRYMKMPNGEYRCVAWCAYFALFCIREAGYQLPGNMWLFGSVTYLEKQILEHGSIVDTPHLGSVIFFHDRGDSDAGKGRHCGIVVGGSQGLVETMEGNISHRVTKQTHRMDSLRISGYGIL